MNDDDLYVDKNGIELNTDPIAFLLSLVCPISDSVDELKKEQAELKKEQDELKAKVSIHGDILFRENPIISRIRLIIKDCTGYCYRNLKRKKKVVKVGIVINVHRACDFYLSKEAEKMYIDRNPDAVSWGYGKNKKAREWSKSRFYKEMPRNCPILVDIVETLGKKAYGESTELEIIYLTKGSRYLIYEDYNDGFESIIIESEKEWSIA